MSLPQCIIGGRHFIADGRTIRYSPFGPLDFLYMRDMVSALAPFRDRLAIVCVDGLYVMHRPDGEPGRDWAIELLERA